MFYKDKNVLVVGGAGFTGANLIKKLLETGAYITATIHKKPVVIDDFDRVEYLRGDLTDSKFCDKICEGQDYVFMCAANTSGAAVMENTPLAHVTPNVIMNSLMLEAAHKAEVKKFLFMSSTTVYPVSDDYLKEDDVTDEFFEKYYCVGWMKRFSEVMCEMYSTKIKNPMTTIIIRPGNLYGDYDDFEWDTSHSTAALIRRVVERHSPLVVWGDGSDLKDLTYISDLVDGMVLAMEKLDKFTIVNMAAGQSYTIKETLDTILEADGYTDADVQYDLTKPSMIKKRLIDVSKAKELLGFEPKIDLKTGIRKVIEWYRSNRGGE